MKCRRFSSHLDTHHRHGHRSVLLIAAVLSSLLVRPSAALVHLRGHSFSFSFLDAPARFAVPVDGSGICGSLHVGNPIDACRPLHNTNSTGESRFVLISRGVCSFEKKVRNAQDAGFSAAIIYDDQDKRNLYSSKQPRALLIAAFPSSSYDAQKEFCIDHICLFKLVPKTGHVVILLKFLVGYDSHITGILPSISVEMFQSLLVACNLSNVLLEEGMEICIDGVRRKRERPNVTWMEATRKVLKNLTCIATDTLDQNEW